MEHQKQKRERSTSQEASEKKQKLQNAKKQKNAQFQRGLSQESFSSDEDFQKKKIKRYFPFKMSEYFDPYSQFIPEFQRQTSFHSIYKEVIAKLESIDDMEVLQGVTTLSSELSMSQEDTLSHIPVDQLIAPLVRCLFKESIPEITLHATMCLTHLIDIQPTLVGILIGNNGIQPLCDKLILNVDFDVAEWTIKCLEKISLENTTQIVQFGGITGMLNLFDFFEQQTQKIILQTVINLSKQALSQQALNDQIIPNVPKLIQLLNLETQDQKTVCEKVLTFFVNILTNLNRMDEARISENINNITQYGLLERLFELLNQSLYNEIQLDTIIYILRIICQHSSNAVNDFFRLGGSNLLQQLFQSESDQYILETMQLLENLLPNSTNQEKLNFFTTHPEIISSLAQIILPQLTHAYENHVHKTFKQSCLTVLEKLANIVDPQTLAVYLGNQKGREISSFLVELLQSQEINTVKQSLQIIQILIQKLGTNFRHQLVREGATAEIHKLCNAKDLEFTTGFVARKQRELFPPLETFLQEKKFSSSKIKNLQEVFQDFHQKFQEHHQALIEQKNFQQFNVFKPQQAEEKPYSSRGKGKNRGRGSQALSHFERELQKYRKEISPPASQPENSSQKQQNQWNMEEPSEAFPTRTKDIKNYMQEMIQAKKQNEQNDLTVQKQIVAQEAIKLKDTVFVDANEEYEDLVELKAVARQLNQSIQSAETGQKLMAQLADTIAKKITTYELIQATIPEVLWNWLTVAPFQSTLSDQWNELQLETLIKRFQILFQQFEQHQNLLPTFIEHLSRAFRNSQELGVLLCEPLQSKEQTPIYGIRMLIQRTKIKLSYKKEELLDTQNQQLVSQNVWQQIQERHSMYQEISSFILTVEQYYTVEQIAESLLKIKSKRDLERLTWPKSRSKDLHMNHLEDSEDYLEEDLMIDIENSEQELPNLEQPQKVEQIPQLQIYNKAGEKLSKQMTVFEILNKQEDHNLYFKFSFDSLQENKKEVYTQVNLDPVVVYRSWIKQANNVGINDDLCALKLIKLIYILNQNTDFIFSNQSPFRKFLNKEVNGISQLNAQVFVNSKLNALLQRQMQDSLAVVGGMVPEWCINLSSFNPFLFTFSARTQLFKCMSFGAPRSLTYLASKHKETVNIRLMRQKIKINREKILEQSIRSFQDQSLLKQGLLEFEFIDEVGTGIGPTLEFYNEIAKKLRSLPIWRDQVQGLFPCPALKVDLELWEFIGALIAKSLLDDRIIDMPFNPVFWKIALDEVLSFKDLALVDKELARTLFDFYLIVQKRDQIQNDFNIDQKLKDRQLANLTYKGIKIKDMEIMFVVPGYDIELKAEGKTNAVILENLEEYIELVTQFSIMKGVRQQIKAFVSGFEKVFPITKLRVFKEDELEELVAGQSGLDWTLELLQEALQASHGYDQNSMTFKNFLELLVTMSDSEKRLFLSFVTGTPRLPLGGLKFLNPRLTVVKKLPLDSGLAPDEYLPSAMTCQHYLKLPDYSDPLIMKKQLFYAMSEGNVSFHLS